MNPQLLRCVADPTCYNLAALSLLRLPFSQSRTFAQPAAQGRGSKFFSSASDVLKQLKYYARSSASSLDATTVVRDAIRSSSDRVTFRETAHAGSQKSRRHCSHSITSSQHPARSFGKREGGCFVKRPVRGLLVRAIAVGQQKFGSSTLVSKWQCPILTHAEGDRHCLS